MNGVRQKSWVALLPILWVGILASLYYATHKPLDPALALVAGMAVYRVLAGIFLISLSGAVGSLVVPGLQHPPLVRLAVQAAVGLGLVGSVLWILGSAIGFPRWMPAAFILIGVALLRPMSRWWRLWRGLTPVIQGSGNLERLATLITVSILVVTLMTALAPPLKFDALVYHLSLPQEYLRGGSAGYLPWLMYWGMPQVLEMLYTAAMSLGGGEAAAVLGWLIGVVATIGILGSVHQYFGKRAAWMAVASLLSGFSVASSLGWGYVEWGSVLIGLAFLAVLVRWVDGGEPRDLVVSGLLAGFATGVKYSGGVIFLCGFTLLVLQSLRRKEVRPREYLLYVGAAGIAVLPWMIKNLTATGNPLYPFLFPAGAMDSVRLDLFQSLPKWGGWETAVLLPLQATIFGVEGGPGFGASAGPLLLGLSALSWIGWRARTDPAKSAISVAALIAVTGLVCWAILSRFSGYLIQTRLYFVLVPAVAFLAGAGFSNLDRMATDRFRPGLVVGALVMVVYSLNLLQMAVGSIRDGVPQVLGGLTSPETYRFGNLGWYEPAVQAIGDLPGGSPVLMLWEPRSYYCAPRCRPDEAIDRWLRDLRRFGEPDVVKKAWLDEGYSHLLVNRSGVEFVMADDGRYTEADWAGLDDLLASLPLVEDFGEAYQLYQLTHENP